MPVVGAEGRDHRRSAPEIERVDPEITDQEAFGRRPPDLVRMELVDQLPVEAALMMINPDCTPDMLRKHQRKIACGERIADHHDGRSGLSGRYDMVGHDVLRQSLVLSLRR